MSGKQILILAAAIAVIIKSEVFTLMVLLFGTGGGLIKFLEKLEEEGMFK